MKLFLPYRILLKFLPGYRTWFSLDFLIVQERKRKASAKRREMMEREKEERRTASAKREEKEKRASIKITIPPPSIKSLPAAAESKSPSSSKGPFIDDVNKFEFSFLFRKQVKFTQPPFLSFFVAQGTLPL